MMIEDMMPTPCACCDGITDFRNLTDDPLGEYDFVCTVCADDREDMRLEYEESHRRSQEPNQYLNHKPNAGL